MRKNWGAAHDRVLQPRRGRPSCTISSPYAGRPAGSRRRCGRCSSGSAVSKPGGGETVQYQKMSSIVIQRSRTSCTSSNARSLRGRPSRSRCGRRSWASAFRGPWPSWSCVDGGRRNGGLAPRVSPGLFLTSSPKSPPHPPPHSDVPAPLTTELKLMRNRARSSRHRDRGQRNLSSSSVSDHKHAANAVAMGVPRPTAPVAARSPAIPDDPARDVPCGLQVPQPLGTHPAHRLNVWAGEDGTLSKR